MRSLGRYMRQAVGRRTPRKPQSVTTDPSQAASRFMWVCSRSRREMALGAKDPRILLGSIEILPGRGTLHGALWAGWMVLSLLLSPAALTPLSLVKPLPKMKQFGVSP